MSDSSNRHRIENDFFRALLSRLSAITPPESASGALLHENRLFYDPELAPNEPAEFPPFSIHHRPCDEEEDPIEHWMRHNPRAREVSLHLETLANALRNQLDTEAWSDFLEYERYTHEQASLLEESAFYYAFRLGQVWPAIPHTSPAHRDPVLRRLARAATDLRSPPGQRLRVLLAASVQALEELYPQPSSPPIG